MTGTAVVWVYTPLADYAFLHGSLLYFMVCVLFYCLFISSFYVVQFFSASPNLTDVNMGTFTRTKRKQKLVYQVETDFDSNGGDESSCDTGPIGNDTEMFSAATANIEIEPASPLASVPSNEPIEDADINNDQPITSSVPDVTGVSRISEFPGICVSKTFW